MTIRPVGLLTVLAAMALIATLSPAAPAADYSHARIVRLSQVQGEVKVARTDSSAASASQDLNWEAAVVNLPIREGDVLATGNGRAVVEFENGAVAYLAENSVLQFTELALSDGARLTALDLMQGTATFNANPATADSFVVRSPSAEVKLPHKGRFRLDVYDDGSAVGVQQGAVDVTSGEETNRATHSLTKGQSLSFRAGGQNDVTIARLSDSDDFDHWVSDHEDSILSATNYASTYVNSPDYSAGLADLYNYGSWFSYSGYGNCWRPFGVSYGWSPFLNGQWVFYPGFGFTWVSFEPWGWMPYHFGGWVFSPVYGWLWVPGGFGLGGFGAWRPATAVFVRGRGGLVGWVPVHPHDARGGTPANLSQGVIARTSGGGPVTRVPFEELRKVKVVSAPPRGFAGSPTVSVAPPLRVSRSLVGDAGVSPVPRGSSGIVFDPREHKFVNSDAPRAPETSVPMAGKNAGAAEKIRISDIPRSNGVTNSSAPRGPIVPSGPAAANPSSRTSGGSAGAHPPSSGTSAAPRTSSPPVRPNTSAPPHPNTSAPSRPSAPSPPSSTGGASRPSSPPPAPAPRTSGSSGTSGSTGRPH